MSKDIYLLLADGTAYKGKSFGAEGETLGEVVFSTGMVGYLETLTDPCYYGQIVVQTFPLIGNYGVIPEDFESETPRLKGYIVREWCDAPSNFRSEGDIDTLLKEKNIIGLYDIDTRALTRKLRTVGVMNGMITSDLNDMETKLEQIRAFRVDNGVEAVASTEKTTDAPENPQYKVALWDLGAKHKIAKELVARGCEVISVPAGTSADDIEALGVDGVVIADGPGDPAENRGIITEIGRWFKKQIPTLGVSLGHQLLALSQGARTEKLKYGHRGGNQPVRDLEDGSIYISVQNHGYSVVADSLPANAKLLYENVNDKTCEGIRYENAPVFSVYTSGVCSGEMRGTDFDGDSLFYEVVEYPFGGDLKYDSKTGEFSYTAGSRVMDDSFTYRVKDEAGEYSDTVEYTISVRDNDSSTVFCDMDDYGCVPACVEMTDKGYMTCTEKEGNLYFSPDGEVSRLDFLVLAMNVFGAGNIPNVENCGFADDENIPKEYKGYVYSAARLGIISGVSEDGRTCFAPDRSITRAEATVILNNIIGYTPTDVECMQDVPEWAQSAVSAMYELGIYDLDDGAPQCHKAVTKAEAAVMLSKISCLMDA